MPDAAMSLREHHGSQSPNRHVPMRRSLKSLTGRPSAGSTLTEVLVTVAVLAIGLLLTTALLTESLRALGENRHRQRAMRLAADIGELLGNLDAAVVQSTTTPASHDCAHSLCTPPQFLADSLQNWQDRAAHQLPAGVARVEIMPGSDGPLADIRVEWASYDGSLAQYSAQMALLTAP